MLFYFDDAKLWRNWYNFVTSYIEYISMEAGITSHQRNHADERQALQDTMYVIGGKWTLPIINSICNGNHRFREIERSIPGITTRMLSRELKAMEMNKLVKRVVTPSTPVLIEYQSTEYCRSFGSIILEMIKWGKEHREMLRSENKQQLI